MIDDTSLSKVIEALKLYLVREADNAFEEQQKERRDWLLEMVVPIGNAENISYYGN